MSRVSGQSGYQAMNKPRLDCLIPCGGQAGIIYAQYIETQGVALFEEISKRDLEGVVAKRKHSIYKNNGTGLLEIKNLKYSQAEGRRDLFERKH
jgi:hypothetical protein